MYVLNCSTHPSASPLLTCRYHRKGKLTHDEHIIYSIISAGGNKGLSLPQFVPLATAHLNIQSLSGVWRRHLITSSKLHTNLVDKALKRLTNESLVKIIKDVRHSTRKVYMLFDFEPHSELTGGPWYADNELDIGFIEGHSSAILDYVRRAVCTTFAFGSSVDLLTPTMIFNFIH